MERLNETWSDRYCVFELITPSIQSMRVILVDDLVATEDQYSEVAGREPNFDSAKWVRLERMISKMALANIESNVRKLVLHPEIYTVHLADLNEELVQRID